MRSDERSGHWGIRFWHDAVRRGSISVSQVNKVQMCDVVRARDDHTADLLSRAPLRWSSRQLRRPITLSRGQSLSFLTIVRTSWWVLLLFRASSAALKLFGCARMVGILRLLINLKDHEITQDSPSARYTEQVDQFIVGDKQGVGISLQITQHYKNANVNYYSQEDIDLNLYIQIISRKWGTEGNSINFAAS